MDARDIFFWIGVGVAIISAIVMAISAFRIKMDDSWHATATRRGIDLDDARDRIKVLETRAKILDEENERITARSSRDRAKVEWYENRYGPIPTPKRDEITTD